MVHNIHKSYLDLQAYQANMGYGNMIITLVLHLTCQMGVMTS